MAVDLADSCFYLDILTQDPFLALEQYGLAVRERQNARPNIYDFPTVCAWYVQEKTHGARINNTAGLVGEMDEVVKTGFLKYSPVALRLVPDSYDMDSKTFFEPRDGQRPPLSAVRRQSMLTMLYVTAGRVLLADSFRTLTPEMLLDLSRIYPIHRQPRSARPVDAFTPAGGNCPRVFDFAVNPDWHQLTLFNPDFKNKATIPVALSGEAVDGALGLDPQADYYAYDFWNDRFLGRFKGSQRLEQELAASESRMISLHRVETNPQFISTNRHVMQGYVDMLDIPNWNGEKKTLTGTSKVIGGEAYKVVVACNGLKPAAASAANATARIEPLAGTGDLAVLSITSKDHADAKWEIQFR